MECLIKENNHNQTVFTFLPPNLNEREATTKNVFANFVDKIPP